MNKNICFVANFQKTQIYEKVVDNLVSEQVNVFWFVLKESQYKYLSTKYGMNNILLLDRKYIKKNNAPIGDFKINELIISDHVLKYEIKDGISYLTNIQQPIYDFIKNNNIAYVFGEITWAHEILIYRICQNKVELSCRYYSDHVIRIPNGKFCFFEDEKQTKIVELKHNNNKKATASIVVEKPDYLSFNNKKVAYTMSVKGLIGRFKRFLTNENIENDDPNVHRGYHRVMIPFMEVIHQISYKFLKKYKFDYVENKKYILFGFHKQPEASIDICGRYFEDQSENVINLWRQLPPNWYLVIKEHSNAIGDRGYKFFKKLVKYPYIILMHEKEDAHRLIRNAQLVTANTGTMALEAGLMNVPAITFSKVFFNKLNYCRHCNWTDLEQYNSIIDLIDEIKKNGNNIEEYTKYIISNSFSGMGSDDALRKNDISLNDLKQMADAIRLIIGMSLNRLVPKPHI
jgi:hypothetical protein